jgi:glycosyltransferase involved in cell wall biosynthesis
MLSQSAYNLTSKTFSNTLLRYEGFSVNPIEVMDCGLSIAATNALGVLDILTEGVSSGGLRVVCENPEALARAIEQLLDREMLPLQLVQNAQNRVRSCF